MERYPLYTIGDVAIDIEPPFPYPFDFDLALPSFEQPLHNLSRSELSNVVEHEVAERAAIFCNALRRIFLDALGRQEYQQNFGNRILKLIPLHDFTFNILSIIGFRSPTVPDKSGHYSVRCIRRSAGFALRI